MTQASMMMSRAQPKARANIYTVLVIVAFVALCFGIGAVMIRSSQLFGSGNPFKVMSATAGWLVTTP